MGQANTSSKQIRLLLVGATDAWREAAVEAASTLGAELDVLAGVEEALRWMLRPDRICTHLLATAPLDAAAIDALAGMVDEVTSRQTPLLLLGDASELGPSVVGIDQPNANSIARAVQAGFGPCPVSAEPSAPALRRALHAGWLRMRFQPILDATTLAPVGLESLTRVHHPVLGILHPKAFLPQAIQRGEERGFTGIAAARMMLELSALRPPQPASLAALVFALNMPLTTFCQDYAVVRARQMAELAALPPARVAIEVVETATMPDLTALRTAVRRWRKAGFGVSIDDAGPGLPHWRQMLDLDVTSVKLDGRLGSDIAYFDLAATITETARARGLAVVAEGIEDEPALARMRAIGVTSVQGFLFSRPLPGMAVPIWLEGWGRRGQPA
jgi:EAL domain-containing protein (putative c-di-GMP-specific phosphodiesterase class I)